ncbi:hypothetical protein BOX15_Mlig024955g1 [Macrostomum lignano]|uniref:C5orf34-like C-terminal domain-containing protein n=1 Tax=Macrostomum lignano TaxID=282301 RepID=A0A267DKQ1_9PLAT|nr:hypothetical protein BOX15_Mlig024955g1 [Macrostomum lignano]
MVSHHTYAYILVNKLSHRGQSGSRWAVATPRTQPVPRRCRQPHLHEFGFGASSAPTPPSGLQWLSAAAPELKSIRIVCRDGVVYRLARRSSGSGAASPAVLVQPGDKSVLISRDLRGAYFERLAGDGSQSWCRTADLVCRGGGGSSDQYLARTVKRAAALCSLLAIEAEQSQLSVPAQCCWNIDQDDRDVDPTESDVKPAVGLDCRQVPGVGRFSVNVNGRARIVFDDRVQLDYAIQLRPELLPAACSRVALAPPIDLPPMGFARLLARDGSELTLNLSEPPSIYSKYARAAVEWSMWLNSSDRGRFYEVEFGPSPEEARFELEKIRNALRDDGPPAGGVPDVEAALRKTRRFLGEDV